MRFFVFLFACLFAANRPQDPAAMLPNAGGALLPLGGVEETAGYKGYVPTLPFVELGLHAPYPHCV